jgi:hypothetical protein
MLISSHAPTLFLLNTTDGGIMPYITVPEAEELCFKIIMYLWLTFDGISSSGCCSQRIKGHWQDLDHEGDKTQALKGAPEISALNEAEGLILLYVVHHTSIEFESGMLERGKIVVFKLANMVRAISSQNTRKQIDSTRRLNILHAIG